MIKNLLDYQQKDKRRLGIIHTVEHGPVKREINSATIILNDSRQSLLDLENDAKNLQNGYNSTSKTLQDLLNKVSGLSKSTPKDEAEIQSTTAQIRELLAKIETVEAQLESIAKNISAKSELFEKQKNAVVKAQTTIKNLTPQYEAQLGKIKPDVAKIEVELDAIARTIDKVLLEKYKNKRKADKNGTADIVVPVSHGRCGGCNFEMPLSLTHKIATDGYIICEECGKIIYKD
ncbi:MAG: hypothetical protein LBG88_03670 [Christensenellaceae bacterium]|jgi:predicted  nucleic acid-binding Zn-ribbon protein|nr:hypothetical protein [Christensenellaceae bacterium]